jgi:hypothetical protein
MRDYHGNGGAQSASFVPRTVQARSLPNAKLSKAERAVIGADIIDGRAFLQGPTVKLVSIAVGCSTGSVFQALKLTPEQREAVNRRERPLVQPKKSAPVPVQGELDFDKLDDAALAREIRKVGIERVLDAAAAAERQARA